MRVHHEDEEADTSQTGGANIDEEDDEDDDELNGRRPRHVEEAGAEVDARDVGRDVVDELAVGDVDASLAAQNHRLAVNGGNERATSENTRASRAYEELVDREGGDELHDPEGDGQSDSLADIGRSVAGDASVRIVCFRSELDQSFRDQRRGDLRRAKQEEPVSTFAELGPESDTGLT